MNGLADYFKEISWSFAIVFGAVIFGLIVHAVTFYTLSRIVQKTSTVLHEAFTKHIKIASRIIFPLLAVYFSLPFIKLPYEIYKLFDKTLIVLLLLAIAWLLIKMTYVLEEVILSKYTIEAKDNLLARKVYTQVRIIKKILIVIIVIVSFSAVLMSFQKFRQLGTGILASAGLAGLVLGFAAQRTLSNLLAGIQIALTQPIRLDDVVIVENEWGRIEEITLTYVVVRIWDLRRLVLPISYFIEKPFQNWTRVSANLLGTVYLHVDYTVPVEEIRNELHRILQNSHWDGNVWGLQVTDATERTIQIRALMSAPDASSAWSLRCEVREKLIGFIQKKYPGALPKFRTEVTRDEHGQGQ